MHLCIWRQLMNDLAVATALDRASRRDQNALNIFRSIYLQIRLHITSIDHQNYSKFPHQAQNDLFIQFAFCAVIFPACWGIPIRCAPGFNKKYLCMSNSGRLS